MEPWMSFNDIKLIEREIINLNKPHISVLEWGSGGSTEHFTKFMADNNITYDWVSLEYNCKWYNKVLKCGIPNTEVVLFDVGNNSLKQRKTNMDEYVKYPLTLGKKFDLILVDGRKRRRCLVNASKIIKPGGIVLLHDAERKYYHCAFDSFYNYKFLSPTLWSGRTKDLISVIMPAFDIRSHITCFRNAVDGIINQTYKQWELLIICDGYFKNTINNVCKVVKTYNDPRIKVYSLNKQRGPGIVRNFSMQYASGNYITFHDTDDYSIPDRFGNLMAAIDRYGYDIVASSVSIKFIEDPTKNRIKKYTGETLSKLINMSKVQPPIHLPSAIMLTSLFIEFGGFEQFKYSSDSLLAIKIGYFRELMGMPPIPVLKDPMFVWNRRSDSITAKYENSYLLNKCRSAQRKPLRRQFRKLLLDGKISVGSGPEEIKCALGIKNNLFDKHLRKII